MRNLFTWFVEGGTVFMSILTALLVAIFFAAWKAPRWVKEIGAFAFLLGFLGTIVGLLQMFSGIVAYPDALPFKVICAGAKVTLIPVAYGAIIAMIALIVRVIQKPRL